MKVLLALLLAGPAAAEDYFERYRLAHDGAAETSFEEASGVYVGKCYDVLNARQTRGSMLALIRASERYVVEGGYDEAADANRMDEWSAERIAAALDHLKPLYRLSSDAPLRAEYARARSTMSIRRAESSLYMTMRYEGPSTAELRVRGDGGVRVEPGQVWLSCVYGRKKL